METLFQLKMLALFSKTGIGVLTWPEALAAAAPLPLPPRRKSGVAAPLADATLSSREISTVERSSKNTCRASASTSLPLYEAHVCEDLLDSLLHEIIALFNSFHDLLAFIGTCRSWRAAVSTFPSVYTFGFPPLHFKPDGPYVSPHRGRIKPILISDCKWQLSDPSKKNSSLVCSVPQNTPDTMHYLGCSYGYLIFSYEEHCLLVDVYTGTKVKPPKLPPNNKLGYFCGIGVLTAPLNSPNSRLLLCSTSSMFEWQVGTDYWSEHPLALSDENIHQIVVFIGDIFVIDDLMRIHTVHLTPQFSMQEVAITWGSFYPINPWLVSCGDMLPMVDLSVSSFDWHGTDSHTFNVFRLDLAFEPAKFVKMEKLENYALFVSLDKRNPTFSCMRPERWGGKSNCIYAAKLLEDPDESWIAVELGQPVQEKTVQYLFYGRAFPPDCSLLSSLWVLASHLVTGFRGLVLHKT